MPTPTPNNIGILLINLGTPDEPTVPAIRKYLKVFLSDKRVVNIPRIIWWPILHFFILPFRPSALVEKYQFIWRNDSPIRIYANDLAKGVQQQLDKETPPNKYTVREAMTYGNPSLLDAIKDFQESEIDKVCIIPLFPQYTTSTTAAAYDAVNIVLKKINYSPELISIQSYHLHREYIAALASCIENSAYQDQNGSKLLLSFHGIPRSYIDKHHDPYETQCFETAEALADALKLNDDNWSISFQSRVGASEWTKPYTDETLQNWGKSDVFNVSVICPGFSTDCLETLEEIDRENRQLFLDSGGKTFEYIPALNASKTHIDLITTLVLENIGT